MEGYRIDSRTGEKITDGFVVCDGEAYFKSEADLVAELRKFMGDELPKEELMELAYEEGIYYWTEWHEEI